MSGRIKINHITPAILTALLLCASVTLPAGKAHAQDKKPDQPAKQESKPPKDEAKPKVELKPTFEKKNDGSTIAQFPSGDSIEKDGKGKTTVKGEDGYTFEFDTNAGQTTVTTPKGDKISVDKEKKYTITLNGKKPEVWSPPIDNLDSEDHDTGPIHIHLPLNAGGNWGVITLPDKTRFTLNVSGKVSLGAFPYYTDITPDGGIHDFNSRSILDEKPNGEMTETAAAFGPPPPGTVLGPVVTKPTIVGEPPAQSIIGDLFPKETQSKKENPPAVENKSDQKTHSMAPRPDSGTELALVTQSDKLTCTIAGTGETIGTVANLTVQNQTDQPLNCVFPPTVFESISGKNQPYVCPQGQTVAIEPHGTATVPMNGVCVNRNKPPVGKGVTGDLAINDGDPNTPQNPATHMSKKDAGKLLRICTAIYATAEKLQKEGAYKGMPYKDPQTQKNIVIQWTAWCDPRISQITGAPPATKEDLKKVVYKQVEQQGPMTPEKKKKVDQGIEAIFKPVQVTGWIAKGSEKPDQYAQAETTSEQGEGGNNPPPSTANMSGESEWTPGAPPQTQEKSEIQDWVDKKKAADKADEKKRAVWLNYELKLWEFCDKSKHHKELQKQRDEAAEKARAPGGTKQDEDNWDKAQRELTKNEATLEKDFLQTKEGEKLNQEGNDAEKAADHAHKAEQEAGKDIDPKVKLKEVLQMALEKWAEAHP